MDISVAGQEWEQTPYGLHLWGQIGDETYELVASEVESSGDWSGEIYIDGVPEPVQTHETDSVEDAQEWTLTTFDDMGGELLDVETQETESVSWGD